MIKSKKTNLKRNNHQSTTNSERRSSYMAQIKNYQCLFCAKKIYLQNFNDAKCPCSSSWFEKLPDKKAKTVEAI